MTTYPDEITVNVTQDDIDNGIRSLCRYCPIALASNRALDVNDIKVLCAEMIVDASTVYSIPIGAVFFIAAFDNGEPVEPFTFTARRERPTSERR